MNKVISSIFYCLGMALFFIWIFSSQSCVHDPFLPELITPIDTMQVDTMHVDTMQIDTMGIPCDSNLIYFDQQVLPILNSSCALSGCHDEVSAEKGIILTSYSRVIETTDVEPFNLSETEIYELITESDNDDRMPPEPNARLTATQIQIIAKWILQGADSLNCDQTNLCDTSMISLTNDITPILETHCTGCHSSSGPSGGVTLDTYNGLSVVAQNGRLVGAITHTTGFTAMPQNLAKLPDCTVNMIVAWVNQGALNN